MNDLIAQLAKEVAALRAEVEKLKTQEGGSGYLLASGARTGATASAQAFTTGVSVTTAATFTDHNPTLIGNSSNGWWAYSYMAGSGGGAQNAFLRAGGSSGSPSAVTNAMSLGSLSFRGHNGSGFTGSKAYISALATENWSGSANGTQIQFQTTPNGSTTLTTVMLINHDGAVGIGSSSPAARLHVAGNRTGSAWGTAGAGIQMAAATYTDSSTATSGTATNAVANSFGRPTFAATNATVTMTNAATVYIANSPAAGTNVTLTNAYALWVDDGSVRLDGNVGFFAATPAAKQTVTGSRGGNAALASLLTALATFGLITDSSTA
jgi:hypothetical protein